MYQNTPAAMPVPSLQGFNPSNANSFNYQAGNPDMSQMQGLPNINQQMDPQMLAMMKALMGQQATPPTLPTNSNSGVGGQQPATSGISGALSSAAKLLPMLLA